MTSPAVAQEGRARNALALLSAALVIGLVITVIVAADRAADPESSPIVPPGSWETVLVASCVLSMVAYVVVLLALRRGGPLAPVLGLAVVLQVVPLFGPTLLSRDAYTYWAYGRVEEAHGSNPYEKPPGDWPDDPATIRMGSSWREQPSLYGPAFTIVSRGVAKLAGESPRRAALLFRTIAALALIAVVALVALLARNRAYAAAFVGLNPLVALHFGGGGHNDALMMAFVLGALALHRSGHEAWSGLAWAVASFVKWVPLAFLGLVALGGRVRSELRLLAWTGASLAVLAVASTGLYGTAWTSAVQRLSEQARRTSSIGLSGWLGDLGLSHRPTVLVIGLLTLAAGAWLGREAWHGRVRLGMAGVLLAALQGWLNPWYALWGLALAAPEEDRTAQVLAVGLSAFLLADAIPRI